MKQKKHLWRIGLMDPRNLAKEVHVYGYNFSWKTHLSLIVCSLLGMGAIGVCIPPECCIFCHNSDCSGCNAADFCFNHVQAYV